MAAFLRLFALTLGLVAAGCPGTDDDDSGSGDDDVGDDDLGDDDATAGDDDDTTTRALLAFEGSAMVDAGGYAGTEALVIEADEGAGAELCRVTYTLTSTAVREDCDLCDWAYDLVVSNPAVVTESGVGCGPFGYSADDLAALDGSARSYGYVEEYIGHASMLMVHTGTLWEGISYATFFEETGDLSYGWDDAYVPY